MRALLVIGLVCFTGCMSLPRVPRYAFSNGPVVYINYTERVPREVYSAPATLTSASIPAEVIGDVVTKMTPELVKTYVDVNRNMVVRQLEVFMSEATNMSGDQVCTLLKSVPAAIKSPVGDK
jgi:hypothetical protein